MPSASRSASERSAGSRSIAGGRASLRRTPSSRRGRGPERQIGRGAGVGRAVLDIVGAAAPLQFGRGRGGDAQGRLAVLQPDRAEAAAPGVRRQAIIGDRRRRGDRHERVEVGENAGTEVRDDGGKAELAVRIVGHVRLVVEPDQTEVDVRAVADGAAGGLRREGDARAVSAATARMISRAINAASAAATPISGAQLISYCEAPYSGSRLSGATPAARSADAQSWRKTLARRAAARR